MSSSNFKIGAFFFSKLFLFFRRVAFCFDFDFGMTFILIWIANLIKVMLALIKDTLGLATEPPDDKDDFHLINIDDPEEKFKVKDWKTGKISGVEKDYFLIDEHFYWDKEIQPQFKDKLAGQFEVEIGLEVKYLLEEVKEGEENRVPKVIEVKIENGQQEMEGNCNRRKLTMINIILYFNFPL